MYNNEMQALMAEGGMKDEGGTKDPVSGNDVPPGALKSEVRDDIDAKISEGEFIFSADVVRYIGLNNLMKLRDEAKAGLAKMESIGQMGNSSEVPDAEAPHGDDFESTLDEVMAEVEKEHAHATGGMVGHYATGGAVSYVDPANAAKYARAPLKGFEMVRFERADGTAIYIPYINGKPQLDIPEGYTMKTGVASSTPTDTSTTVGTNVEGGVKTGGAGGRDSSVGNVSDGNTPSSDSSSSSIGGKSLLGFANISVNPDTGVATADKPSVMNGIFGAIVGTVLGVGPVIGYKAEQTIEGKIAENKEKDYNMKFSDTAPINGLADSLGMTPFGPANISATEGVTGTGGQAAVAGAAAASAAQNAGYSDAACAAAGQAAASAALAGATQAAAIAAGMDAAKQQDAADKNASASVASSSGPTAGAGSYGYGDSGSASAAASGTVGGYGPGTPGFGGGGNTGTGVGRGEGGADSNGAHGAGGPGVGGNGVGRGEGGADSSGAHGAGSPYAKGGLVSKPHNKSKKKKSGIASR